MSVALQIQFFCFLHVKRPACKAVFQVFRGSLACASALLACIVGSTSAVSI